MAKIVIGLILITVVVIAGLFVRRFADERSQARLAGALLSGQPAGPTLFDPEMLSDLPEPARRYFLHAISPGTPLLTSAEIRMEGVLDLGTKEAPQPMRMIATQILAYPKGFVWDVEARRNHIWISGADGALDDQSFSRFWLFGFLPVVRAGGTEDHARSAFGRYAAEAVFWTPAALLPQDGIEWVATGQNSTRVTMIHGGFEQALDLTVDEKGRPVAVGFDRWTDANPHNEFRWQRFGGYLSEFQNIDGFTLPTRVEAGNFFQTDTYYPFFQAKVTSIRFPSAN